MSGREPWFDALHAVAVALVSGDFDGLGNSIPQNVWDDLYERGLLRLNSDQSGEHWPIVTSEGDAALIAFCESANSQKEPK